MVEREQSEKKRLSMENEELMWKIRQNSTDQLSMSAIEGSPFASSGGSGASSSTSNLSCSFTEGCPKSLPPFMGRIPLGKRISDPDFDPEGGADGGADGPASPRVLEVVEKTESVSWKIEYKEQLQQLQQLHRQMAASSCHPYHQQSPGLKRKLSPHSPRMARRTAVSRSMESVSAAAASPGSPAAARRKKMAAAVPPPVFEEEPAGGDGVFPFEDKPSAAREDQPEEKMCQIKTDDKVQDEVDREAEGGVGEDAKKPEDEKADQEEQADQEEEAPQSMPEKEEIQEPSCNIPMSTPDPVNIANEDDEIDLGDISSSSEIEIANSCSVDKEEEEGPGEQQQQKEEQEEQEVLAIVSMNAASMHSSESGEASSPEQETLRADLNMSAREQADWNRRKCMGSSLQGFDLNRMLSAPPQPPATAPSASAGEAMSPGDGPPSSSSASSSLSSPSAEGPPRVAASDVSASEDF